MLTLLLIALAAIPAAAYFVQKARSKPGSRWPVLASILKLQYLPKPPRMQGLWNGRKFSVESAGEAVRVTAPLSKPSRLRVEIGPRADVERRAGIIVPDPVATGDADFDSRCLARCSDKPSGRRIVDPTLRRRVLAQPGLDLLGQGAAVNALIPSAEDVDSLENVFEILSVVAGEMEAYG